MWKIVGVLLFVIAVVNSELVYSVSSLEGGNVLCTVTNNGNQQERFLGYSTPFEREIFASVISVMDNIGREAKYVGKIGKRVFPAPESSYITVAAGESISAVIDIHQLYNVHQEGHYSILPRLPNHLLATVGASISKFLNKSPERQTNIKSTLASKFKDCSNDEKSTIKTHRKIAEDYVDKSKNCLDNNDCNTYTNKWFGASSSSNSDNYKYVRNLFRKMRKVVDDVNIDCQPSDCGGPDTFAYVFPDDPQQIIYLCGAYWSSPDDSERTQTIIHEYSHFDAIGNPGTDDFVYGPPDCLSLATTNSDQASRNADNIGYFAIDIGENYVGATGSNASPNSSDSSTLVPFIALLAICFLLF